MQLTCQTFENNGWNHEWSVMEQSQPPSTHDKTLPTQQEEPAGPISAQVWQKANSEHAVARWMRSMDPSLVFSYDSNSQSLRGWNIQTYASWILPCVAPNSRQVAISLHHAHYYDVCDDLWIRDIHTGKVKGCIAPPSGFTLHQVVTSPHHGHVGVYLENATYSYFAWWNLDTGKEVHHLPLFYTHRQNQDRSSQLIQTGCRGTRLFVQRGNTLYYWDISNRSISMLSSLPARSRVVCAEHVPWLVTLADDHLSVWSGADSRSLTHRIKIKGTYQEATFSPDGLYLATAATSGYIQVWHLSSGRCVQKIARHLRTNGLLFSQQGHRLLISYLDGTVESLDTR